MNDKRNVRMTVMFVLSFSLISAFLTAVCMSKYDSYRQFRLLGNLCQILVENEAIDLDALMTIIKENKNRIQVSAGANILAEYGYCVKDFMGDEWKQGCLLAAMCFAAGALLFLFSFFYWHKKECGQIQRLAEYLEKVQTGRAELLEDAGETQYARLQDEIYKTVTELYQTRDDAFKAKHNFADHLYNIAHQLKTPITAISLSAQMLQEKQTAYVQGKQTAYVYGKQTVNEQEKQAVNEQEEQAVNEQEKQAVNEQEEQAVNEREKQAVNEQEKQTAYVQEYAKQIQKQAAQLSHLEEALLLLSRIDAGTLVLERKKTDVFTLLCLAADQLQELFGQAGVSADIPQMGEAWMHVDMEWMMEAVINLLKNCMEHSPAGAAVHCAYEENPLYVQIRIWDEGEGFVKEDIPHLFERFYRGKRAVKGGIGIGLPLAREIIEMQNGMISAGNLPEPGGGACFEIRMYCH